MDQCVTRVAKHQFMACAGNVRNVQTMIFVLPAIMATNITHGIGSIESLFPRTVS